MTKIRLTTLWASIGKPQFMPALFYKTLSTTIPTPDRLDTRFDSCIIAIRVIIISTMSKEEFLEIIKSQEFTQAISATFSGAEFSTAVKRVFESPEFSKAVSKTYESSEFTEAVAKTFEGSKFSDAVSKTFEQDSFSKAVSKTFTSEEFKIGVKEAIKPDFENLTETMREFRDEVLEREDTTVGEIKSMRTELASFSNRVTRIESHVGLR